MDNFKKILYNIFSFVLSWIVLIAFALLLHSLVNEFGFFIGLIVWIAILCMTFYCIWYKSELEREIKDDTLRYYISLVDFVNYVSNFDYSKLKIIKKISCNTLETNILLSNNICITRHNYVRDASFFDIDIKQLDNLLYSYNYTKIINEKDIMKNTYLNNYISANLHSINIDKGVINEFR